MYDQGHRSLEDVFQLSGEAYRIGYAESSDGLS